MSDGGARGASPAREAAWRALVRLRRERAHLDDSAASLPELDELDERDRSLANELVAGTVRRRATVDAVLARFTRAPLRSTQPAVLEALRMGAFQLLFLDRVPAYAVVDDSVTLAAGASRGSRGFVNAVLRKVAAEGREQLAVLAQGEGNDAWSCRHSVPRWIVALLRDELGDAAAAALLDAASRAPERCLRVNTLESDVQAARTALEAAGFATRGVPGLPAALLYDGPALERSAPFREGLVTPQSRGSQMAGMVAAAGLRAGAAILDVCAAPGTKTAHLAALARDARLTAVDVDEARLVALRANLARLGAGAAVVAADAPALPSSFDGAFDAVLLDAPATASTAAVSLDLEVLDAATVASDRDRWRRRAADVPRLAALQRRLIVAAGRCVSPGGRLTYSVCTLPRAETVDVVDELVRAGGWEVDDLGENWPGAAHPAAGGYLLVLPPGGGSSGFFIARLRRVAPHPGTH